jgi:hypothetical protein
MRKSHLMMSRPPYRLQVHVTGVERCISLPGVRPGDAHEAWLHLRSHEARGAIDKPTAQAVAELLSLIEEMRP